jgi:hypothetical protein
MTLLLEQVAEGYRAMDERRTIKAMLRRAGDGTDHKRLAFTRREAPCAVACEYLGVLEKISGELISSRLIPYLTQAGVVIKCR